MKTPAFWYTDSLLAHALVPLSWLYRAGACLRARFATPYHASIPVLCIGNVVAGGGGKTPLALAIGEHCKAQGMKACFISRGYGGRITAATRVLPEHSAADVGDEPLLLARTLPCIVGANRKASLQLAEDQGFSLAIMDDGFQNPTITKTSSILVLKGMKPLGNGNIIPAGPLREPLAEAAARADAVVWVDAGGASIDIDRPMIHASTSLVIPQGITRAVAFAGIARPELFFEGLRAHGLQLVATHGLADHTPPTREQFDAMLAEAKRASAALVCTQKDAVKLTPSQREGIIVIGQTLAIDMNALLRATPALHAL